MRRVRRGIAKCEIWLALRLGALADMWAYLADCRLRELSKNKIDYHKRFRSAK